MPKHRAARIGVLAERPFVADSSFLLCFLTGKQTVGPYISGAAVRATHSVAGGDHLLLANTRVTKDADKVRVALVTLDPGNLFFRKRRNV